MTLRLSYYDPVDDLWKRLPVPEAPAGTPREVAVFLARVIRDTYDSMRSVAERKLSDSVDKLNVYLEYPRNESAPRFRIVELELGPQDRMHVFVDQQHQLEVRMTEGMPRQQEIHDELVEILTRHIETNQVVDLTIEVQSRRRTVGLERHLIRNAWHNRRLKVRVLNDERPQ